MAAQKTGRVKWFSDSKGYGFIECNEAVASEKGGEIFVHYTAIEGEGFKTLAEGQVVGVEWESGQGGLQASRVFKLDL